MAACPCWGTSLESMCVCAPVCMFVVEMTGWHRGRVDAVPPRAMPCLVAHHGGRMHEQGRGRATLKDGGPDRQQGRCRLRMYLPACLLRHPLLRLAVMAHGRCSRKVAGGAALPPSSGTTATQALSFLAPSVGILWAPPRTNVPLFCQFPAGWPPGKLGRPTVHHALHLCACHRCSHHAYGFSMRRRRRLARCSLRRTTGACPTASRQLTAPWCSSTQRAATTTGTCCRVGDLGGSGSGSGTCPQCLRLDCCFLHVLLAWFRVMRKTPMPHKSQHLAG